MRARQILGGPAVFSGQQRNEECRSSLGGRSSPVRYATNRFAVVATGMPPRSDDSASVGPGAHRRAQAA